MRIQDFQQIARSEGNVVIDKETKELKTQSWKGRLVSFITNKEATTQRNNEVKESFFKAIRSASGLGQEAKARELIGLNGKPLTARDIRLVLNQVSTVNVVNQRVPGSSFSVAETAIQKIYSEVLKVEGTPTDITNQIKNMDLNSRDAQAFNFLGVDEMKQIAKTVSAQIGEQFEGLVFDAIMDGLAPGKASGLLYKLKTDLPQIPAETRKEHLFNVQSGDVQVPLFKAGFTSIDDLNVHGEKFDRGLYSLTSQISHMSPGRHLDRLMTASTEDLRGPIIQSLLTPEQKLNPDAHVAELLRQPSVVEAVDRVIDSIRAGFPKMETAENGDATRMTIGDRAYVIDRELGRGMNGVVYRFLPEIGDGPALVVKQPTPSVTTSDVDAEVGNHRYINDNSGPEGSKHFSSFETLARGPQGNLFIVMKEETHGTLSRLIERNTIGRAEERGSITTEQATKLRKAVMLHLLEGASIMRNQLQMLHLDVKPENIFISGNGEPKFADFGTSLQNLSGSQATQTKSYTEWGRKEFGAETDGFALAITFYQLLKNGDFPVSNDPSRRQNHIDKHDGIQLSSVDSATGDDDFDQMIFDLTRKKPEDRLTVEQIAKSPYFNDVRDEKSGLLSQLALIMS
ncbi:MAG: protein kinase [Verrucomicrobiales bacterium]|nr:protein kinase [Verrucomicrobiales bacterium]